MEIGAIWPAFVCMGFILLFVGLPVFQGADLPPSDVRGRISTLDGLRGFLAFGVFFHHALMYHALKTGHGWSYPPSLFYTRLGGISVSMFFMITGYLFWGKMIREGGRPKWLDLFIGRIFRIMPVYLLAIGLMLLAVFAATHGTLLVPPVELLREIGCWLAGGLLPMTNVNLFPRTVLLTAGVTWTLQYEWFFYLSLPLTAIACRFRAWPILLPSCGLAVGFGHALLHPNTTDFPIAHSTVVSLFSAGMLCAAIEATGFAPKLPRHITSAVFIGLMVAASSCFTGVYGAGVTALLVMAFFLAVFGCDVFGLLTSRLARRLGNLSFGIYLLQGLVMSAALGIPPLREYAVASLGHYWITTGLCGAALTSFAFLAHIAVERPGIALGRRVSRRLRPAPMPARNFA